MTDQGQLRQGGTEVPTELMFQIIGEQVVMLRVQGERLQAMGAELQRVYGQQKAAVPEDANEKEPKKKDEKTKK